jgi:hypothetical protein
MLIDLECIPEDIKKEVLEQFVQQQKDRSKLFNYFIQYRLKNLMENINEF